MNTIDIVNNVATSNNLSPGRAELAVNSIIGQIIEKLKVQGQLEIQDFGTFHISAREAESGSRRSIVFQPNDIFLKYINE